MNVPWNLVPLVGILFVAGAISTYSVPSSMAPEIWPAPFLNVSAIERKTGLNSHPASVGVFISTGSGNWDAPSSWQLVSGFDEFGDGIPGANEDAYVQAGHKITLIQNQAVNDLHISTGTTNVATGGDGKISLGSNTLSVNGKLRCYFAPTGIFPGTSSASVPLAPIDQTAGGKISFVGNSRNITSTGEWNDNNTGSTSTFAVEFNLAAGQTATLQVPIRASSWNILTGTLDARAPIEADNGTTGSANITIAGPATLISDQTGTTTNVFQRTSTTRAGTLTVSGVLRLSGAAPAIAMNTVTLTGSTVDYARDGAQSLAAASNSGAVVASYTNIKLSGSGAKSTLAGISPSIAANGALEVSGGPTPATLAFATGTSLSVSSTGTTLKYTAAGAQATGSEWVSPAFQNLTIDNPAGVTLPTLNKTVNGTLTLANGVFAFPSSGLTLNGTLTTINGSLGGGANATLILGGSGAAFIVPTVTSGIRDLFINRTTGATFTGPVSITSSITTGAPIVNAQNLVIGGTFNLNNGGSVSGSPTYTGASTLRYNTGGTALRGAEWLPDRTSGAGYPRNVQVSSNTILDLVNGAHTSAFETGGNVTIDGGCTLDMSGGGFNGTSGALTVRGSVINSGILKLSDRVGGDLNVYGSWDNTNGTLTHFNNRVVTFLGSNNATLNVGAGANKDFAFLVINKPGGTATISAGSFFVVTLVVDSDLRIQAGTLDTSLFTNNTVSATNVLMDAGAAFKGNQSLISVRGNWTNNGSFIGPNSTVSLSGLGAYTHTVTGTTQFGNLTINAPDGQIDLPITGVSTVGYFRVQAGTVTGAGTFGDVRVDTGASLIALPGSTITSEGNWNNNGTFTANTSTVMLSSGYVWTVSGDNTFYNLTKVAMSPSEPLNFAAGSTQTVTNALTLAGSPGNFVSLRSTVDGTNWNLRAPATQNVDYVDVRDSDNSTGITISPTTAIDSGNNLNWSFGPAYPYPTTQASSITFSTVQYDRMSVGWTNGNGVGRVVKINTVNSFTAPVDGTDSTANSTYSGSGEQVVFNGSGNSVVVTGLSGTTTYWLRIYEYKGSGAGTKFLTVPATGNPASQVTPVAPLIGTYLVGAGQVAPNFATLGAALSAYSQKGIGGPVTFSLTDDTYPSESYPITFAAAAGSSPTNTLTIKPASGKNPVFSTSLQGTFQFNGAANVIIDGSNLAAGQTRNLSINNTFSGSAALAAVSFIAKANNIVVKNAGINVAGCPACRGVEFGPASAPGTISNVVIQNDLIAAEHFSSGGGWGILLSGNAAAQQSGVQISGNIIDHFGIGVLNTGNYVNGSISGNLIRETSISPTSAKQGINLNSPLGTYTVSENQVIDIRSSDPSGSLFGIQVNATGGDTVNVYNNQISLNNPSSTQAVYGFLTVGDASAAVNLYFNSVRMDGPPGTLSYGFRKGAPATAFKNNIIYNLRDGGEGIHVEDPAYLANLISNNNDVYITGTGGTFGFDGTSPRDLSAWRSVTGNDANTMSADPNFFTPTILTVLNSANQAVSPVARRGIAIPGITTDFQGQVRKGVPDIGADEFQTFVVSSSAGPGGSISPVLSSSLYNPFSTQSFTITPDAGNRIAEVTDNGIAQDSGSPYVLAGISADHTITVSFSGVMSQFSISGHVLMPSGRGVTGAHVTLSGASLSQPLTFLTNRNGAYTFSNLLSGQQYTVTVAQRRFRFSPPSRDVVLTGDVTNADFLGIP